MAAGSEIGVFLTSYDGASYDNKGYENIKYTATGTGADQSWATDEQSPVILSMTKAKVYGYYPRQESGVSLNSITISNDGNDWMYTPSPASNVSIVNPSALLRMKHAMTIIRVKVLAGSELSSGTVSRIALDGAGWATSATLDLQNGTIGSYTGEGTELVANDLGELSSEPLSHDFWVVSNEKASRIAFKVTVSGDDYIVYTPKDVTLERGKVYNYTVNISTLKEATLSDVVMTDWTYQDSQDLGGKYAKWSEYANGVYAIDNAGELVDYETASAAPVGTYKGVAVVMKGWAFEVAKKDASTSTTWAETSPMTDTELAYFSSYYIYDNHGFLRMPDGSYHSESSESNRIPNDISTWTSGVLADVDGKANTERILAANVTIASVIREFNTGPNNQGVTSWYLPAAGQLAYIFMNYDKINNLLPKVNGTTMTTSDRHWSSSVYSVGSAWLVVFNCGHVDAYYTPWTGRVRLLRDL